MADILLDRLTHDLVFVDGELQLISGPSEVGQRIKITLLAQLGEWLFDTLFGVPYLQEIFVKDPDLGAIEARLRGIIFSIEGVESIDSFELIYDPVARTATVNGQVSTIDGSTDFTVDVGG